MALVNTTNFDLRALIESKKGEKLSPRKVWVPKYCLVRVDRLKKEWVVGVNHTSIYSVFSKCLCNLNARFTPIFLKITLIPHLLMFFKMKRKIKQGKSKKLRRKNLLFEALVS